MGWKRVAEWTLLVAVLAAVASIVSTWTRSGRRDRNGIATLESLDRLDLLDPPWDTTLVVVSAAVPLFLAVAAAGVALERRWVVVAGALTGGLVLGAWALVVLRSPLSAAPGPHLAVSSAFALAVTSGATARAQRRDK